MNSSKSIFSLLLVVFFSSLSSPAFGQKWRAIQKGLAVIEGLYNATQLYDWLTEEEEEENSTLIFTTSSTSPVSIYVNGAFIGNIVKNRDITCKVVAGNGYYQAFHKNGTTQNDNFVLTQGMQHNVFITESQTNMQYAVRKKYGFINGNTVNFRRTPEIGQNLIFKLSKYDEVEIIDKMIISGNNSDRILLRDSYFQPIGEKSFKILKDIAVKFISYAENNHSKVRLYMKDGSSKIGFISNRDLGYMKDKKWYKVRYGGYTGWVYGKLLTEK